MTHPITILPALIFVLQFLFAQSSISKEAIDPTGTYRTHFKNENGAKLPQSTIKVKRVKSNKIIVSLIMQNGEPLLRSGSFMDTLTYSNNYAVFKKPEFDSTCKITLHFSTKGITVRQTSKFEHFECDFADGVSANGFYRKESSKIPDFKNPY